MFYCFPRVALFRQNPKQEGGGGKKLESIFQNQVKMAVETKKTI